jgi:hypothetical protein
MKMTKKAILVEDLVGARLCLDYTEQHNLITIEELEGMKVKDKIGDRAYFRNQTLQDVIDKKKGGK